MGREILRATNLQKLITEYAKLTSILSWDTFVAEIKALPTTKSCIAEYALRLGGGGNSAQAQRRSIEASRPERTEYSTGVAED